MTGRTDGVDYQVEEEESTIDLMAPTAKSYELEEGWRDEGRMKEG